MPIQPPSAVWAPYTPQPQGEASSSVDSQVWEPYSVAPQPPAAPSSPTPTEPPLGPTMGNFLRHSIGGAVGEVPQPLTPELQEMVYEASSAFGVPYKDVATIMGIESSGGRNPGTSSAGAQGMMQLLPSTFKGMGVGDNIQDPKQNIYAGVKYYANLLKEFKNPTLAAMAYNMGPNGLRNVLAGKATLPTQTREYARRFESGMANMPDYKATTTPLVSSAPPRTSGASGKGVLTAARGAAGWLDQAMKDAKVVGYDMQHYILDPVNAVVGAPERLVEGVATAPQGSSVLQRLGAGFSELAHPGEQTPDRVAQLHHNLEQIAGVGGVIKGGSAVLDSIGHAVDGVLDGFGIGKNNQVGVKTARVIESFLDQTAIDPLTYAPFAGEIRMGERAVSDILGGYRMAAAAKMSDIAESSDNVGALRKLYNQAAKVRDAAPGSTTANLPVLEKLVKIAQTEGKAHLLHVVGTSMKFLHTMFGKRPELDAYLGEAGKNARIAFEQRNYSKEFDLNQRYDENILKPNEALLHTMKSGAELPDDVRVAYLSEPFLYGTPEMREQAIKQWDARDRGTSLADEIVARHLATPEQVAAEPEGLLDYDLRSEYQSMMSTHKTRARQKLTNLNFFKTYQKKYRKAMAAFEESRSPRTRGYLPEDQYNLVQMRLHSGAAVLRARRIERDTQEYLAKHPEQWILNTAPHVDRLSMGASTPGWAHMPVLRLLQLSRTLQKLSISINPIPHELKNVAQLVYLKGGLGTFASGLRYASDGLSDEQMERLIQGGVDANYVRGIEGPLGHIADYLIHKGGSEDAQRVGKSVKAAGALLQKAYDVSNSTMTRLEMGYRQALLDYLDKQLGPSFHNGAFDEDLEYRKMADVRNAVGDYSNVSLFVKALDALGGPFVAFRLGIVPGAVARAVLEHPQRVARINRAQLDLQDANAQSGYVPTIGGPVEDFSRLVGNPLGYLTAPSSSGLLGELLRTATDPRHNLPSFMQDLSEQYLPGGAVIDQTGMTGYRARPGVSLLMRMLAGLYGAYFRLPSSWKSRERYIREVERGE